MPVTVGIPKDLAIITVCEVSEDSVRTRAFRYSRSSFNNSVGVKFSVINTDASVSVMA